MSPHSYSSFWGDAEYQEDLVVLEDDEIWKRHSDTHKLAVTTTSFYFVRDADDVIQDISNTSTLPSVNSSLYLTNTWHTFASWTEICKDIREKPAEEQQSLIAALEAKPKDTPSRNSYEMPKAQTHRLPKRKVNAARREATAEEKRMYAKQFTEAKHAEYKSWNENDVFELIDIRK